MPTASTAVEPTARMVAIAESAIAETRAHVGRRLAEQITPAYGLVDLVYLKTFAEGLTSGWTHSLDFICHRALAAAGKIESYKSYGSGYLETFKDNDERAIYRAAHRLAFICAGEEILARIDGLRGGIDKMQVIELAEALQHTAFVTSELLELRDRALAGEGRR